MTITSTMKFKQEVTQQQYFIGLDVQANQWSVCVRFQKMELKIFTCEPNPDQFASTIRNLFPGSHYNCVYESGFSGYSIHKKLTNLGLNCSVVHPLDIPTTNKEKLALYNLRWMKMPTKILQVVANQCFEDLNR